MPTATFNTAFESGLVRLKPRSSYPRAVHLIDLSGDGLLCRPTFGYDTWAPAPEGVAEPSCKKCIALYAESRR